MHPTRAVAQTLASKAASGPAVSRVSNSARQARHASTVGRPQMPPVEWHAGRALLGRIGKCLAFGCNPQQTAAAAGIVRTIATSWPGIQLSVAGSLTPREAVHRQRLWEGEEHRRPGGSPAPWQNITRSSLLVQVTEQAATRFLDYTLATASPDVQKKWQELRDESSQTSGGRASRLVLQDVSYNCADPRILEPQTVSAYTQMKKWSDSNDAVEFSLQTIIWSHKYMDRIADAQLTLACNKDESSWLDAELRRMAQFTKDDAARDKARRKQEVLLAAIAELEKSTWDRADATEDFGSASSQ